jgi:cytoskeletal protein RodZ
MSAIPATWEVEIEESCFEASTGKKLARHYLKNKLEMVAYI